MVSQTDDKERRGQVRVCSVSYSFPADPDPAPLGMMIAKENRGGVTALTECLALGENSASGCESLG